jgi:hypothetical protein
MAGTTGLEPAASAVTGQRSNQLNYVPLRLTGAMDNELNPSKTVLQANPNPEQLSLPREGIVAEHQLIRQAL